MIRCNVQASIPKQDATFEFVKQCVQLG